MRNSRGCRPHQLRDHPAGRRALATWLGTEPAPELEFEAMVRLAFADHTKQQALAAIDSIARHAEQRYREGLDQVREYQAGDPATDQA